MNKQEKLERRATTKGHKYRKKRELKETMKNHRRKKIEAEKKNEK